MITETSNNQNVSLIAGRAGELTLEANPITFDLLESIFGQYGPFREALKEFGVKVKDTPESYLVLKDGKVFTDIEKEQNILWGNYPIKLEKNNHDVEAGVIFSLNPIKYLNYFQKSISDSKLIINSEKTVEKCLAKYKYVSEQTVKVVQNQFINEKMFLELYKDITYVSYAYEVFEMYNRHQITSKKRGNIPTLSQADRKFIQENDYLLADTADFIENILKLPKGFYLDDYTNLTEIFERSQGLYFIPGKIDTIPNAEVMLQCLKNNLRLKTNVLLFILNMTLLSEAAKKGISPIADKNLSQLM